MSEEKFARYYEQLDDAQLAAVLADRKDLVPGALAALDREVKKRKVTLPEPERWMRSPDSQDQVLSLEDYSQYRQVCRKARFWGRYYWLLALSPWMVVFSLARLFGSKQIERSVIPVAVAGAMSMFVLLCSGLALLYEITFKCPLCGHRFGSEDECFSCGFPRLPKK